MANPVRQPLTSSDLPSDGVHDLATVDPGLRSSIQILVVDENRPLRETTSIFLGQEGYSVTTCGRGTEALDLFKRRRFDIVLLDLYMGQVPGIELLKACLLAHRDTIAIMMTGNPSVATNVEAVQIGAWDYLPKPFSATHLQLVIGRAAHTILATRKSQSGQVAAEENSSNSEHLNVLGRSPSFR